MLMNDDAVCNTWYQALIAHASDYAGIFSVGSKRPAYFASPPVVRVSPSGKMCCFIPI